MNLLPPRIIGPVSECSDVIWVQGQMPGALVEIEDDTGAVVASDVVSSADATVAVTGSLSPGRQLSARQELGADSSDWSPETVEVLSRPDPLGPGIFSQPVFRCARCLWIDGLLPGARVQISQAGTVLGTGSSVKGYARVSLSQALTADPVLLEQEACGAPGEPRETFPIEPPASERRDNRLPPPKVESPLQECRTRLTISEVFPGARVELERSMGPNGAACFDLPSLWWGMNPPLALNETIRARQMFLDCEIFSDWSSPPVAVGPLEPVPVPVIIEPLCAEGTTVRICNLLAGATVKLIIANSSHHGLAGGDEFFATAPEDGCFDFIVPAPGLPAGGLVGATQTLCARESELAGPVMVMEAPEELPRPVVEDPLYACSITVRVSNLHPGTRVYVSAEGIGVIGEAHVLEEEMDITVSPALMAGWKITAWAIGCGKVSEISGPVEVQEPPEELPPPVVVEPVHTCDRKVTVRDLIPGASVDIYVNGVWAGRGMAGASEDEISVDILPLEEGDQVHAVQKLCEVVSRPGRAATVTVFDGEWEVLRNSDGDIIQDKSEILAVHAALLPTGWIVIFSGDDYTDDSAPIDNTRLMQAGHPWTVQSVTGIPEGYNLFCCGHSLLADGTVVTGGGTESRPPSGHHTSHFLGIRGSMRFRPDASGNWSWEAQGDMVTARPGDYFGDDASNSGGRWYPTLITLPDGRSLAIGGHPLNGDQRHTNSSLETYDPATKTWDYVGSNDYQNIPGWDNTNRNVHAEYFRMHVMPDNTVFAASSMRDGEMWKWNIGNDANDWTLVSDTPSGYGGNPQPFTTVLLPLRHRDDYQGDVLICGRTQAHTIRPRGTLPKSWTPTAPRTMPGTPRRRYPLATLLPTGEVFVSGGASGKEDTTGLLEPEIFDPTTGQWRWVQAAASQVRNYHSTALLLPDGSVWHSGSNEDCDPSGPGNDTRNRTVEIYRPWYFCWPRPRLTQVTSRVCHGDEFTIRTPDAGKITEVVLVRLSSFTHAFNPDQRVVEVEFRPDQEDGESLRAFMPGNPAIAIVGHYLCFILDENRVPSVGHFMQVCPDTSSASASSLSRFRDLSDLLDLRNSRIDRNIFERAVTIAALLRNQKETDDE